MPDRRALPLYAALGDSTGTGYGARRGYVTRLHDRLAAEGLPHELANLAQNGATAADVRASQLRNALALRPSLATVGVGGNDLLRGADPGAFEGHLDHVIEALRVAARVVLLNVPDLSLAPLARLFPVPVVRRQVATLNERLARIAERHGVALADLHGACRGIGDPGHLFCSDGLHPSDEGHERIALAVWPVIERALRRGAA